MIVPLKLRFLLAVLQALPFVLSSSAGEPLPVVPLWPDLAPGDKGPIAEEHDTTQPKDGLVAGRTVIRLGDVYKPSITIHRPAAGRQNGSAVVVCPGGGYSILAMDLEGTEVCDWLNSVGVTGVLLKYRVPKRPGLEKHTAPLQDVQRALGLVRSRAGQWGIDPHRVGVLGFSAGGHLAAMASTDFSQRSYPAVDEADQASCRPDFSILIYPAYLTVKDPAGQIAPELKLTTNTPPTFIAMAQDDPIGVDNALFYALALRKFNVPFELHVYPVGGHGYGLRPTEKLVTTWPLRAADWMRTLGPSSGK
jgi:acetyl esterase/lipase